MLSGGAPAVLSYLYQQHHRAMKIDGVAHHNDGVSLYDAYGVTTTTAGGSIAC